MSGLLRRLGQGVGAAMTTVGKMGYETARIENLERIRNKNRVADREDNQAFQQKLHDDRREDQIDDKSDDREYDKEQATTAFSRQKQLRQMTLDSKGNKFKLKEVEGNIYKFYDGGQVMLLSTDKDGLLTETPAKKGEIAKAPPAEPEETQGIFSAIKDWFTTDSAEAPTEASAPTVEAGSDIEQAAIEQAKMANHAAAVTPRSRNAPVEAESLIADAEAIQNQQTVAATGAASSTPLSRRSRVTRDSQKAETSPERQQVEKLRTELEAGVAEAKTFRGKSFDLKDYYTRILSDPKNKKYHRVASDALKQLGRT